MSTIESPVLERPGAAPPGAVAPPSALLPEGVLPGAVPTNAGTSDSAPEAPVAQWVEISDIEANPFQPRRTFRKDKMQKLVASVAEHGIIQPVLVRPTALFLTNAQGPHYQLVAGERRWRAAREAGLRFVPAVIRVVTEQQALELALIENDENDPLLPLERANGYRQLRDEFGLSQAEIAKRVNRDESFVSNTLRLLDLPLEVQAIIGDEEGQISGSHGVTLCSLKEVEKEEPGITLVYAQKALNGRWSQRDLQTEINAYVTEWENKRSHPRLFGSTESSTDNGEGSSDGDVSADAAQTAEAVAQLKDMHAQGEIEPDPATLPQLAPLPNAPIARPESSGDSNLTPVTDALRRALHGYGGSHSRWDERRKDGLSDADLRQAVAVEFGRGRGESGPGIVSYYVRGGADPALWVNQIAGIGEPVLKGSALVTATRQLLEIPYPTSASSTSSNSTKTEVNAKKVNSTPATRPAKPADQFKLKDHVMWQDKNKWHSGKIAEVGKALYWVQKDGSKQRASFNKKNCILQAYDPNKLGHGNTSKGNSPWAIGDAVSWDGAKGLQRGRVDALLPGGKVTVITDDTKIRVNVHESKLRAHSSTSPTTTSQPSSQEVRTAKEIAADKASASTTVTSTPATPAKAPPGFLATFVPEAEAFKLEDAGISIPQLFQIGCKLLSIGKELGIGVFDVLASIENYYGIGDVATTEPATDDTSADDTSVGNGATNISGVETSCKRCGTTFTASFEGTAPTERDAQGNTRTLDGDYCDQCAQQALDAFLNKGERPAPASTQPASTQPVSTQPVSTQPVSTQPETTQIADAPEGQSAG